MKKPPIGVMLIFLQAVTGADDISGRE